MGGFNLPPGCSPSDIPGNRPEDIAEEQFWDELHQQLQKKYNLYIEDEYWESDWFIAAVSLARDMGYSRGYSEGRDEAAWAADEAFNEGQAGEDI